MPQNIDSKLVVAKILKVKYLQPLVADRVSPEVRRGAKREPLLLPAVRFSPLAVRGFLSPSHQVKIEPSEANLCEEKAQKQDAADEKRHTSSTQRRCDASFPSPGLKPRVLADLFSPD